MSESNEAKNHAEEFVQHDKYGQEQDNQQNQQDQYGQEQDN